MAAGAVSATAFDPWAALAKLRAGRPAPAAAAPISNFSSFSGGEAADPENHRDAVAAPISKFSGFSSGEAVHSEIQAATDDLVYLAKLAARRRRAIAEGRDFWTRPDVLAAMHAHRLDPGEDVARIAAYLVAHCQCRSNSRPVWRWQSRPQDRRRCADEGGAKSVHCLGCSLWGRPGMFAVEIYAAVRSFAFIKGNSRREAARVFGLSRETVLKMCRFSLLPGHTRTALPLAKY
jgi:hypothetical protein